ncbi:MAG: hypothetical protein ACD_76C00096G0001 [uncultured bacterium]|nr:MAG: hypothetical protein ACD_76C00096G0001 [uncultured bacterium]HBD05505.1 hypothetical protein [Candidatus Uhrbacteria bacterium]
MTFDIVTIGDVKRDDFVVLPESPLLCSIKEKGTKNCKICLTLGEKIPVKSLASQIAGTAANVAVGMSRLGLNTAIVSIMGQDEVAELTYKQLGQEGVDTRYISTTAKLSSSFSVVLTYKGDRTILASHSPFRIRLPRLSTKWFYAGEQGNAYETLYKELITSARKINNTKLALNPGAVQIRERKKILFDLLKETDVLFVNKEEAEEITKQKNNNMEKLIHILWKLGPEIVAITDGKNGSYAFAGTDIFHCKIFPANRVEATGAGDSFSTGFLAALMHKKSVSEALRWGNANAASVVSEIGPQKGLLTKNKLATALQKSKNIHTKEL